MRDIPDFPRPGIVFKDITPLLLDPRAIETAVDGLVARSRPREVDFVVAAEARGFILGAPLALSLAADFVPARAREAAVGDGDVRQGGVRRGGLLEIDVEPDSRA